MNLQDRLRFPVRAAVANDPLKPSDLGAYADVRLYEGHGETLQRALTTLDADAVSAGGDADMVGTAS